MKTITVKLPKFEIGQTVLLAAPGGKEMIISKVTSSRWDEDQKQWFYTLDTVNFVVVDELIKPLPVCYSDKTVEIDIEEPSSIVIPQ
jgi:hypothetical protein